MGTEAISTLSKSALQAEIRRKKLEVKRLEARAKEIRAYRERAGSVQSQANNTSIWVKHKEHSILEVMKSLEDRGKARGRMNGGYIAGDLAELQKTILLCDLCRHGFDWKKHHYYNKTFYDGMRATGRCDVCRVYSQKLTFYLHEAHRGFSWTPLAEQLAQRRKATFAS
jgi:hypothetical protein